MEGTLKSNLWRFARFAHNVDFSCETTFYLSLVKEVMLMEAKVVQ
jgi:hypothetical protein